MASVRCTVTLIDYKDRWVDVELTKDGDTVVENISVGVRKSAAVSGRERLVFGRRCYVNAFL